MKFLSGYDLIQGRFNKQDEKFEKGCERVFGSTLAPEKEPVDRL